MKNENLLWAPRALSILFIIFLSLFSLDVFNEEGTFAEKIIGFVIHSKSSILLALFLVLCWKRPLLLGWIYLVFSIAFTIYFHSYRNWSFMSLPLFLATIGFLFLWISFKSKRSSNLA